MPQPLLTAKTSPLPSAFTPFCLGGMWQERLHEELRKSYMIELAAFLEKEYAGDVPIYPPQNLIFNAFLQVPFDKVKVVVIGQDPYHGAGQAHGLSFSVPRGVKPPPSLQNIFKELNSDLGITPLTHGCLIEWAQQGLLLLNSTLTVRQAEPLSHRGKGWESFTDAVVRILVENSAHPLIFVLWGKHAQDKCRHIIEENKKSRHYLLTAAHPSPYSAQNFFGCRHFSKINEILKELQQAPINWILT